MSLRVIFSLLLATIAFNSCKRDYPSTTPKWLREKITEFKRYGKCDGIDACYDGRIRIEECRENTTGATLYRIAVGGPTIFIYYDKNGAYLDSIYEMNCSPGSGPNGCPVGSYNSWNIDFVQLIWTPKHCD